VTRRARSHCQDARQPDLRQDRGQGPGAGHALRLHAWVCRSRGGRVTAAPARSRPCPLRRIRAG